MPNHNSLKEKKYGFERELIAKERCRPFVFFFYLDCLKSCNPESKKTAHDTCTCNHPCKFYFLNLHYFKFILNDCKIFTVMSGFKFYVYFIHLCICFLF